ncbi:leucine-rich repeat domain-containing protein [Parvicella tangerina]|nr:leucine-rich repeat domain-containing protein [Parvicella tangerina]
MISVLAGFSQKRPDNLYLFDHYFDADLAEVLTEPEESESLEIKSKADLDTFLLAAKSHSFNNLKYLSITGVELTALPPDICELIGLEELYLKFNKLSDLPDELSKLTNLQVINLEDNALNSIPKVLETLKNLHVLKLGGNKITALMPEIASLTKLTDLYLGADNTHYVKNDKAVGNPINQLPTEITQLTELERIDVSATGITGFSPEIITFFTQQNVAITHFRKQLDKASSKSLVQLYRSRTKTDFGKFDWLRSVYSVE